MKRTLREVLQQIVTNLSTPGLLSEPGSCQYRGDSGKPCIIASLLPAPLIERIVARRMNREPIRNVIRKLGPDHFVESLGDMTPDQACAIQTVFDGNPSQAREGSAAVLLQQVQPVG